MSGVNIKINVNKRAIADKIELPLYSVGLEMDVCNKFIDIVDPYVPYDTGKLSGEVDFVHGMDGSAVVYTAPYAAKQYYGEHFNHNTEHHPLATAHWDKVAMQTERERFVKEVEQIVKGRYKNGQK